MAYDYQPRQIQNWDFAAQTAIYREKWLHQTQETAYWRNRAQKAETAQEGAP